MGSFGWAATEHERENRRGRDMEGVGVGLGGLVKGEREEGTRSPARALEG